MVSSKKTTKRKTVWRSLPIAADSAEPGAVDNGAPIGGQRRTSTNTRSVVDVKPVYPAAGPLGVGDNLDIADAMPAGDPANVTTDNSRNGSTAYQHHHQQHPHHVQRSTTQYEGRNKPLTSFHRHYTHSSSSYNDHTTRPTQHPRRPSNTSSAGNNETTPEAAAAAGQELTNSENNSYTSPSTSRWNGYDSGNIYSRTDRYAPHRSNNGSYSGSSYRRRPFSSNSRYYGGNTRSTFRIHRETELKEEAGAGDDKENDSKPLFNEDDYTRITTPRQDVLFKKGYLSRPKPHAVPVETTEPAPAEDVAVITIEEAIAAGLVHGYDPENPFLGFYDATGVFYVNPYLNGVEPFNGSMVMAPYGSEPYSINPTECHVEENPTIPMAESTSAVPEEFANKEEIPLVEPTNPIVPEPEVVESTAAETVDTPEDSIQVPSPESDEAVSNDDSPTSSTTKGDDGDGEETTPEATIDGSTADFPTMPGFIPQYLYPFVCGAPAYIPPNYLTGQSVGNSCDSYVKFNRFKKRKRRPFRCPYSNEVSTTTTDYSEDDDYLDHNQHNQELSFIPNIALIQYNGLETQTALTTEVSEFVANEFATEEHDLPTTPPPSPSPLILATTTLNADVAEFHPRTYTSHKTLPVDADTTGNDSEDSGVSTSDVLHSSESSPSTPDPITETIFQSAKTILDPTDPPLAPITHNHTNTKLNGAYQNSQQHISDIRSDPSGSHSDKHSTEVSACLSYAAMAQRKPTALPVKSDLAAKDVIVMPPTQETGTNLGSVETRRAHAERRNSANTATNRNNTNSVVSKNISHSKPTKKSSPSKKKRSAAQNATMSDVETPTVGVDASVKASAVDPTPIVVPEVAKPTMPSFAQLLRPAGEKEVRVKEAVVEVKVNMVKERPIEPPKSIEISHDIVENAQIKAAIAASISAPTYQTIKVKGRKRTVQHVEPADFWEEKEDPIVVEVKPVAQSKPIEVVVIEPLLPEEDSIEEEPTKTKAKKSKSKRSTKKSSTNDNRKTKTAVVVEEKAELAAEDDTLNTEATPSAEPQFDIDDTEQLDIEEYNFVTDPQAIFVNAIASANIFSSPRSDKTLLSQSGSAGFGGMFTTPTFGTKSPMGNLMLRQEEDMVMRIMRSLSSVEPKSPVEDVVKELIKDEVLAAPLVEDEADFDASQEDQNDEPVVDEVIAAPLVEDEAVVDATQEDQNDEPVVEIDDKIENSKKQNNTNEVDVEVATSEVNAEEIETGSFLVEETNAEIVDQITALPEVEINSENSSTNAFDSKFDEVKTNHVETTEITEPENVTKCEILETTDDHTTVENPTIIEIVDTKDEPSTASEGSLQCESVKEIEVDIEVPNTELNHSDNIQKEERVNGHQLKNSIHDIDSTKCLLDSNNCNDTIKLIKNEDTHINGSNGHIEYTNGFVNGSHKSNGFVNAVKDKINGVTTDNCPSKDLEYVTFHTEENTSISPEIFTKSTSNNLDSDLGVTTLSADTDGILDEIVESICKAKLIITSETAQLINGCEQNGEKKTNGIEEILEVVSVANGSNGFDKHGAEETIESSAVEKDIETSSSLDQSETDGCSELSSMDTDDDDRTIVGPLDEYIEDVMIDGRDSRNILNCGEFYEGDDLIMDPIHDGDIDELIKQAEQIVRLSTGQEPWSQAVSHSDSTDLYKDQDRNESPRSSEDSGILENHDEPITSATESESGQSDQYLKFPLTDAVSRWLSEKSKEKSPEPIIRIPEDPILSGQIEKSIQRFQISEMMKSYADDDYDDEDEDDYTADESDFAEESATKPDEPSKNLQSNPLLASSAEDLPADDTDTSKRVAAALQNPIPDILMNTKAPPSSPKDASRISAEDDPDILEYWENDPMLRSPPQSKGRRVINYAQLLAKVGTKTTLDFVLNNNANCTKYPSSTAHMTKASSAGPPNPSASHSSKDKPQLSDSVTNDPTKQSPEFGCVLM